MSKLGRITPCHACPWKRNSIQGYLGSDKPESFFAATYYGDVDMPCHTQIDYSDPNWLQTQEPNVDMCAGALIFMANHMKLPRDERMAAAVRQIAERTPKSVRATVFSHPAEFFAHHERRELAEVQAEWRSGELENRIRTHGLKAEE